MTDASHIRTMIVLPLLLNFLVTPIAIISVASVEEFLRTPIYYTYTYGFALWSVYHVFLVYLVYRFVKKEGGSLKELIGPMRDRTRLLVAIVIGLLGLSVLLFQVIEPMVSRMVYGPGWWTQFITEFRKIHPAYILYGLLVTSLTAGICEEVVWRGYLQTRLEHRLGGRVRAAVTIQAIHFGLWHFVSVHTVFTAIFGFIAGLIYAKIRKLVPIMIAHWLGDVIGFSMLYFELA